MHCKGRCGVPLQLLRVQLRVLYRLMGGGERSGPPCPQLSHLPPLPSCQVRQLCGHGMSQLTPLLSAGGVWVDRVVFWFLPDQLS